MGSNKVLRALKLQAISIINRTCTWHWHYATIISVWRKYNSAAHPAAPGMFPSTSLPFFPPQWRKQHTALLTASTANCQVHGKAPWQHNAWRGHSQDQSQDGEVCSCWEASPQTPAASTVSHLPKLPSHVTSGLSLSRGKKLQTSAAWRGHLSKDSLPQLGELNKTQSKDRISLQHFEWPHKAHTKGQKPAHTVTVTINLRFIAKHV